MTGPLFLIMPNGKERKTNIKNVKPFSTTELVKCLGLIPGNSNENQTSKLHL